jgi:hypothetical protein
MMPEHFAGLDIDAVRWAIAEIERLRGVVAELERWDRSAAVAFEDCKNPDCPIGCPDAHAITDSYLAMIEADADAVADELAAAPVAPKPGGGVE